MLFVKKEIKICAATFYANSIYYKYPIEIWKEQLTGFNQHIKQYPEGHVRKPEDIATCQNETLKEVFEKGYDFCLFVQADIWFDKAMTNKIKEFAIDFTQNYCFGVEDIRLYHYFYKHHFGISLIGKKNGHTFIGDGAYPENYNCRSDIVMGYSMGYLGRKNRIAHLNQQKTIWDHSQGGPPPDKSYRYYRKLKYEKVYKEMIDRFGLYEEYIRTK
jgi:hypothetical protein